MDPRIREDDPPSSRLWRDYGVQAKMDSRLRGNDIYIKRQ